MNHPTACAAAALAGLSLIWGYNWVLMKQALEYAEPFHFAAYRTGIGAATLFAILQVRGRLRRPARIADLAILGFFQIAVFTAVTMLALVSGDPGKVSILVYTMPVWSMFFAWLLLRHRPHRIHFLATGTALVGIVCMAQPWRGGGATWSVAYALAGAAAWGFSTVHATRLREAGLDNLSMNAWSMGLGAAMLVIAACFVPSAPLRWDTYFTFILLYNAVIAMAMAWLLWAYVLERLSIMAASVGVLAVPLVGSASSALQLGERFSAAELAGMAAILLGISAVYFHPVRSR